MKLPLISQSVRVVLSIGILFFMAVSICVVDRAIGWFDGNDSSWKKREFVEIASPQSTDRNDVVFSLFKKAGGFHDYRAGAVPTVFSDEVLDLRMLPCNGVCSSGNVVGFVLGDSRDQASQVIKECLFEQDWVLVDANASEYGDTYIKSTGSIDWLFVSMTEVTGSTSVWMEFRLTDRDE